MNRTVVFLLTGSALLHAACSRTPAAPADTAVTLAAIGSTVVYGPPNQLLDPVEVVALDAATKLPEEGITVEWRVVAGSGTITPPSADTDIDGVSSAAFRATSLGTYRVRATAPRMTGATPEFEVRIVDSPQISSVQPTAIAAGTTITINGSNFSTTAQHNTVLFDGVRGTVTSATATELRVTAPACLPGGSVTLTVALGSATSNATQLQAAANAGATVDLAAGQSRTFTQPAELACVRLPGGIIGAQYLFTAHNFASVHAPPTPFELRSLAPGVHLDAGVWG
jgi:hypothetical protein